MQQSNVDAVNCVTIVEAANRLYDRERWLCPDCAAEIYFRKQELVEAGYIW
ncbi:MAG TPA: hypothetical protein VGB30_07880 [bacterium]|jgi:hypothetical protein